MSQELGEALSVVRTALDGVPIVLKGSYSFIKDFMKFLFMLKTKFGSKDKERLKALMKEVGEKQFVDIPDSQLKDFTKKLDKLGVNYVVIPDDDPADGKRAIMFNDSNLNIIERCIKEAQIENSTIYKDFEAYSKAHPNWDKSMEAYFADKVALPTVAVAEYVNKKGSVGKDELTEDISSVTGVQTETAQLAIENAVKEGLVNIDGEGKVTKIDPENFNNALAKHFENEALMRGRAFMSDPDFQSRYYSKSSRLTANTMEKLKLPENDKDTGALIAYYYLPGTQRTEIIAIPQEQICAEDKSKKKNEIFFGNKFDYTIFSIEDDEISDSRILRGKELSEVYFDPFFSEETREKTQETFKEKTKDSVKETVKETTAKTKESR